MAITKIPIGGTIKFVENEERTRPANDWGITRRKYRVDLRCEGRSMWLFFYTGDGIAINDVTLEDVLESLYSDAAIVINDEFRDVEADAKTERALIRQTDSLRRVLGDHFDAAVFPEA